MPIVHKPNMPYLTSGLRGEVRCTCGVLLVGFPIMPKQLSLPPMVEVVQALDKHLIGVLETQWVRQFYQEV